MTNDTNPTQAKPATIVIEKLIHGHFGPETGKGPAKAKGPNKKNGNNRTLRRKHVEDMSLQELNTEMEAILRDNEQARREIDKRNIRYTLLKAKKETMEKSEELEAMREGVASMETNQ